MATFAAAIAGILRDAPAVIAAAAIETASGVVLAFGGDERTRNLGAAAILVSELVAMACRLVRDTGMGGSPEDLVLTGHDEVHLIRVMPESGVFVHIVAPRFTNLAVLRTVIDRHLAQH